MEEVKGIDIQLGSLKIEGDATKLFEELARAQADFEAIPETAEGQIGRDRKFKYADFATLTRYTRPHLSKRGIVLLQPLHYENGKAVTTTILAGHGARIMASFHFTADPNPQDFGKAHTYYRRYQLQGILGLEGEDADSVPMTSAKQTNGFSEPEKKTAPKALATAGKSPAPANDQKTDTSAAPSDSSTTSTEKTSSVPADDRPINARIIDAMKQLTWKMDDLKAFYKENVDKKGFDKADNLPPEVKESLWRLLIEKKGVLPSKANAA